MTPYKAKQYREMMVALLSKDLILISENGKIPMSKRCTMCGRQDCPKWECVLGPEPAAPKTAIEATYSERWLRGWTPKDDTAFHFANRVQGIR